MRPTRFAALRSAVVDTVFPPRCAGCGRRGWWVCPDCEATTAWVGAALCLRCGAGAGGRCRCREFAPELEMVRAAAHFEGWVRAGIIHYKFGGEFARASHLSERAAGLIAEFGSINGLVPVPLHPRRLRERGYDQALLLATDISRRTGVPVIRAIRRQRDTAHQVGLDAESRRLNVAQAFVADPAAVSQLRVVLIDDVMTTGATLGACAEALRVAGAAWVGALTIARER